MNKAMHMLYILSLVLRRTRCKNVSAFLGAGEADDVFSRKGPYRISMVAAAVLVSHILARQLLPPLVFGAPVGGEAVGFAQRPLATKN